MDRKAKEVGNRKTGGDPPDRNLKRARLRSLELPSSPSSGMCRAHAASGDDRAMPVRGSSSTCCVSCDFTQLGFPSEAEA
eukprot:10858292-Alexandrium_andersonii.AAC.1